MNKFAFSVSALVTALILAGCSTTKDNNVASVDADAQAKAAAAALSAEEAKKRRVLFDFNSFAVKKEFDTPLSAHANTLKAKKGTKVVIEGHADERGSAEYNLALGQKRADAVKRVLSVQGVAADSIETVSFGKEKPLNLGHDEAAWADNRRAEIKY